MFILVFVPTLCLASLYSGGIIDPQAWFENEEGTSDSSTSAETPTPTPSPAVECETDQQALQTAVYSFYYESDGNWPVTSDGDIIWDWLVPHYLNSIPDSDSLCNWHMDSSGLVYATGVDCPCSTEPEPSPALECKYIETAGYPELGADYQPIVLCDNPDATDVAWSALKDFLRDDKIDEMPYIEDVFMCADFAEMLHNNAEAAGIRAAWVGIDFYYGPGHAINAFNTTDRGLVFIDVTNADVAPCSSDSIATVIEGKQITYEFVFPCADVGVGTMEGIVEKISITW